MKSKKFQNIAIFAGASLLLSFSLAFLYHFLGGNWEHPYAAVLVTMNSLLPMVLVYALHQWVLNAPLRNSIGKVHILSLWNLAVILGSMVYVLISIVVLSFFPGVEISHEKPLFLEQFKIFLSPAIYREFYQSAYDSGIPVLILNLGVMMVWGLTFNLLIGLCEEIAWRGFLFYQLREFSFLKQALIQGFLWALWYSPFVWFTSIINPFYAVVINFVFFMLLSPIYLFVRYASNSLFSVAILHGMVSSYSYFADIVQSDTQAQWLSSYIQVNFYLLILVDVLVLIYFYTANPNFQVEFEENEPGFVRKTVSARSVHKKDKEG